MTFRFKGGVALVVVDERLAFYDTDFTNYARTVLSEYASKTLEQREYLYAYRMVGLLQDAIRRERFCKFYMYVVGIDSEHQPQVIRLAEIHNAFATNEKIKVTEEMCELINDLLDQIYEEEYNECSDESYSPKQKQRNLQAIKTENSITLSKGIIKRKTRLKKNRSRDRKTKNNDSDAPQVPKIPLPKKAGDPQRGIPPAAGILRLVAYKRA